MSILKQHKNLNKIIKLHSKKILQYYFKIVCDLE
jgi:hypothetical protein